MMRAVSVLALLCTLPACVYCDCIGDGARVHAVDAEGSPALLEGVTVYFEGERIFEGDCPGEGPCSDVSVNLPRGEGTYTVALVVNGEEFAEDVEFITPKTSSGCCGKVFFTELDVVVPPLDAVVETDTDTDPDTDTDEDSDSDSDSDWEGGIRDTADTDTDSDLHTDSDSDSDSDWDGGGDSDSDTDTDGVGP